jgi:cytochrome P450
VSYILAKRDELRITDWEMAAHSNALIVAGSETSATVLSGLHYYLLNNPDTYQKLKEEVRGRFQSVAEVDAKSIERLPYLTACIEETFRIYPPIPIAMPRVTPKGGCEIAGRYVPEGVSIVRNYRTRRDTDHHRKTTVGVHMWSVTHNSRHFTDPDTFRPERWTDPDCTDHLDASKPFLVGPRMCMGIK